MTTTRHLHPAAVKLIIHVLLCTFESGCAGSPLHLQGYCVADWAGYPKTHWSTTGWCRYLGNALVSWRCKKQKKVSKSSSEAACCATFCLFINYLASTGFIRIVVSISTSHSSHVDNASALKITKHIFHETTKHIEVDCRSIGEAYDDHTIALTQVSMDIQEAYILTKALTRKHHPFLIDKLLLHISISNWMVWIILAMHLYHIDARKKRKFPNLLRKLNIVSWIMIVITPIKGDSLAVNFLKIVVWRL